MFGLAERRREREQTERERGQGQSQAVLHQSVARIHPCLI
jgi:hypothetical protein